MGNAAIAASSRAAALPDQVAAMLLALSKAHAPA
jgi:hypothetical protein